MKPPILHPCPLALAGVLVCGWPASLSAQVGPVFFQQKISSTSGGFGDGLSDYDQLGTCLAWVGDINGDGIEDLAAGTPSASAGASSTGRVWILFLNRNGTVWGKWPIDNFTGGLQTPLDESDQFGSAVASLGDFDGDGIPDIAAGARGDDNNGVVHVLLLNRNGTVRSQTRIPHPTGTGRMESVTALGDLNGDGVADLAVGDPHDGDGGLGRGAVWIMFLNPDGTVLGRQKISSTQGGLTGPLLDGEEFGGALVGLGDLDGDGLPDLAVGQWQNSTGGFRRGAVWLLFMNPDGTVRGEERLDGTQLPLENEDYFGWSVGSLGDLDEDGVPDVVVGTPGDDDLTTDAGAVWMLMLQPNGTIKTAQKISRTVGGFTGNLGQYWRFGSSVAGVPRPTVGAPKIAVGVPPDTDGGQYRGSIWVLFHSGGNATAAFRNGSGVNPPILVSYSAPSLGTTWSPELNCIGHADGLALLLVYAGPANGPVVPAGQILVGVQSGRLLGLSAPHQGGIRGFPLAVPYDPNLCGLTASVQGVCFGAPGTQLSNAYDIVLGL